MINYRDTIRHMPHADDLEVAKAYHRLWVTVGLQLCRNPSIGTIYINLNECINCRLEGYNIFGNTPYSYDGV